MKKQFLLLVMALMSMTAWAAVGVTTAPTEKTGLAYNGSDQALLATAGTATGEAEGNVVTIYYMIAESKPTFYPASHANWLTYANVKKKDAGTYKIWYVAYDENATTASTIGDENYVTVTVAPKTLTTAGTPITTPADGAYTGADQKTAYNALVNVKDGSATIPADQFDITYTYSTTKKGTYSSSATVMNAGFYKQIVSAKAGGNYTGTMTTSAFEIAKADLMVKVKDYEEDYYGKHGFDGGDITKALSRTYTAADLEYTGFLGTDTKTDITEPTITNTNKNAGSYEVIAAGGVSTNYNFVYVKGKLVIAPRKVKVIALDKFAPIGSEEAELTSWTGKEYFSTEADHLASDQIKLQLQNGFDGEGKVTYEAGYVTTNAQILGYFATTAYKDADENDQKFITGITLTRPAGTDVKEYALTPSGATAISTNYELVYTAGKFVIGKAVATITLDNLAKVYGEEDPEFTYTITGVDEAGIAAIKEKITITRSEGEAVGSYDVTLTVADNESFTDYTVPAKATAKLIITKRPLKITANDQVLYTGNTILDLNQEAVTYATLANDETVKVKLSFGTVDVNGLEELTAGGSDTKSYDGGIVVTVEAGQDAVLKNYTVTTVAGKLTVIKAAAVLFLDDNNASLDDVIKEADTQNRLIQFSSRVLKAGQWNTLVLPFTTTVTEISAALGYAVVDILAPSTSPETISLKLAFGEIPANTPFLVQPAEDINMNSLAGTGFGTKTIVYSADPKADDGQGHLFKGTYKGYNVTSADKSEYFYSSTKKSFVNSSKSTKIGIMRAYLKDTNAAGAGARIITIEEPDGSVTAIDAIEAGNGETNGAIYNLQGVRVNKAGKGVYIQNGKKFIK